MPDVLHVDVVNVDLDQPTFSVLDQSLTNQHDSYLRLIHRVYFHGTQAYS